MIKPEPVEQLESNIGYISENYTLLEKEPVLYSWQIDHVQPHSWLMAFLSVGLTLSFIIIGGDTSIDTMLSYAYFSHIAAGLSLFFVICILMSRYLFSPNQLYHYSITAKGIYYTKQDNIPDVAYSVARGIGYLVVIVSILAVSILGPMALVGAGGGVFLSGALRKMRPKVKCFGRLFVEQGHIRLFNRNFAIYIRGEPHELDTQIEVYCSEENYQIVLKTIYPFLDNYEVQEVDRWRDFDVIR